MLKSFNKTAMEFTDIILAVDSNQYEKYKKISKPFLHHVCIAIIPFKNMNTTQMINQIFDRYRLYYDYFGVTNDDVEYKTIGWDKELMLSAGAWGIAYGNDLYLGEAMPTFSIISANIVNTLGWLQMPKLKYLYGDCVWKVIGRGINRLIYRKDVITEHHHFLAKKSKKDQVYNKTNSHETYRDDDDAFRKWVREQSQDDINKIKEAMSNE